MPSYIVNDGRRAVIGGRLVQGGDKVTLDAAVGDQLVADGVLVARRAPTKPGGRRSAWTAPTDDTEDDGEG